MEIRAPEDIAKVMTLTRKAAGITQQQLALAAGSSRKTISHIENGLMQPSIELAARLLNACGARLVVVAPKEFEAAPNVSATTTRGGADA